MIGRRRPDGAYYWTPTRRAIEAEAARALQSLHVFIILAKSTEDPAERSSMLDRAIEHGLALDRIRADLLAVTS